jgi:hypothetical protein
MGKRTMVVYTCDWCGKDLGETPYGYFDFGLWFDKESPGTNNRKYYCKECYESVKDFWKHAWVKTKEMDDYDRHHVPTLDWTPKITWVNEQPASSWKIDPLNKHLNATCV